MGDYTQSSITIIDWPRGTMVPVEMLEDIEDHLIPEDPRAGVAVEAIILNLLDLSGYRTTDYGFPMSDAELLDALREGATFTQEQTSYDAVSNIEDRLIELGCTFEAHFEPKYEWDGEVIVGTPGFPVFRTTANSDGSEYTMDSLIVDWLEESADLDDFRRRFEEHSGKEVTDAVNAIRERLAQGADLP